MPSHKKESSPKQTEVSPNAKLNKTMLKTRLNVLKKSDLALAINRLSDNEKYDLGSDCDGLKGTKKDKLVLELQPLCWDSGSYFTKDEEGDLHDTPFTKLGLHGQEI